MSLRPQTPTPRKQQEINIQRLRAKNAELQSQLNEAELELTAAVNQANQNLEEYTRDHEALKVKEAKCQAALKECQEEKNKILTDIYKIGLRLTGAAKDPSETFYWPYLVRQSGGMTFLPDGAKKLQSQILQLQQALGGLTTEWKAQPGVGSSTFEDPQGDIEANLKRIVDGAPPGGYVGWYNEHKGLPAELKSCQEQCQEEKAKQEESYRSQLAVHEQVLQTNAELREAQKQLQASLKACNEQKTALQALFDECKTQTQSREDETLMNMREQNEALRQRIARMRKIIAGTGVAAGLVGAAALSKTALGRS
uniref:Uncharacterized protein n=1 Tax=viral metagenome TaxID=1070528 RepID=A0A6C0BMX5_9ZZZZ